MLTRRAWLKSTYLTVVALPLLAACGAGSGTTGAGTASATVAAPAASVATSAAATSAAAAATTAAAAATTAAATTAAKASAASTTSAAAAVTAATTSTAAAVTVGKGKTQLSIAVWDDTVRTWHELYARKYAEQHPEITLEIDKIAYGNMAEKQLTELAAGTLQDISFAGVKWLDYTAYRGGFRPLDDLVKQHNMDMNDFFSSAIIGCSLDGKLYALPFETNSGNDNIMYVNTDLLATRGVTPPTDSWTMNDFLDIAHKMTDPAHQQWGTDYNTGSYYDFATLARSFGGDILSADTKSFTLNTDPNTVKAAEWLTSLRTTEHVAPLPSEAKGVGFTNGNVALSGECICSLPYTQKTVNNKFKFDLLLFPLGPTGLRGYEAFVTTFAMYAQTKHVPEAFDLLTFMTSPDTATWAMVNQGQPPARKSVWNSPEAAKISPAYARIAAWMGDGKNKGPFPMPYNLRFTELENMYEKQSPPVWQGKMAVQGGLQQMQSLADAIMAEPRS
jgi:multiple sugar transport system substrate-binding protein